MDKTAVVLLNLGGPDSPEAVQPFLYNLFRDPDIFKIPVFGKTIAKLISKRRAPKVIEQYKQIGGKSPINDWTEKQRSLLEEELRKIDNNIDVYIAMRYWNPLTAETADIIAKKNYERIVLMPLYPHYSLSTTQSSFNEWERVYCGPGKIVKVNNWHDNELYLQAVNEKIDDALSKIPEEKRKNAVIVFSAHGIPVSYVEKGDPYNRHINCTVDKIMQLRKHSHNFEICYQSKVGPVKWLEPSTDQKLIELANRNTKDIVIVPISFVSDHIETLFEVKIEYGHIAKEAGIENYIMTEGLNDSKKFISALKNITLNYIS